MDNVFLNNDKPILRWSEPHDGIDIKKLDNGFCNRIFHWEIGYYLNQINQFSHDLYIEDYYWPELSLINLPLTFTLEKQPNQSLDEYHHTFKSVHNNKPIIKIGQQLLSNLIKHSHELQESSNYISNFGYNLTWSYIHQYSQRIQRPLKNIRLKNNDLENFLLMKMDGVVGFHIRRGFGVKKNHKQKKYLDGLHLKQNFEVNEKGPYQFFDDEYYFAIMNKIIDTRPNTKFYLSTDLEETSLTHFKEQYTENVITFQQLLEENIVKKSYFKSHDSYHQQIAKNMIDLFALSFCSYIVMSNESTWSQFASEYRNTPSSYINEPTDGIVTDYFINTV